MLRNSFDPDPIEYGSETLAALLCNILLFSI